MILYNTILYILLYIIIYIILIIYAYFIEIYTICTYVLGIIQNYKIIKLFVRTCNIQLVINETYINSQSYLNFVKTSLLYL